MDYYKVLGLKNNAGKEEIKQAFRKLAMQFHPDKHSHSSNHVRDDAAFRFKQISEAYDVLMDDSKRAKFSSYRSYNDARYTRDYYNRRSGRNGSYGFNNSSSEGFGYGYSSSGNGNRFMFNVEGFLRYLTTRDFLRNLTFAGALLGAVVILDVSGEALWKKKNTGKSFDEAMESIKDAKSALKEKG